MPSLYDNLIVNIQSAGGIISFADFMAQALYTPGLGYYSGPQLKFGKDGDFVTAPEISNLFSKALARQAVPILSAVESPCILEFGAGSGIMAVNILLESEALQQLPERYFILEVSGDLRTRQQTLIEQQCPHLANRVQWLERLPSTPIRGVVLANEVLDAQPCLRFCVDESGLHEMAVTVQAGQLDWIKRPWPYPESEAVLNTLAEIIPPAAYPYVSEINPTLIPWFASLSDVVEQGLVLISDYGYPQREYYHPQRRQGTLRCYHRHQAHDNPFIHIGEQDITAHVDFTAVAQAAFDAGFKVEGFTNQALFLMNMGIAEWMPLDLAPPQQMAVNQELKMLTLPGEMGEAVKFIALTKKLDHPLQGFSYRSYLIQTEPYE